MPNSEQRKRDYDSICETLNKAVVARKQTVFSKAPVGSFVKLLNTDDLTIIKKISNKSLDRMDPTGSDPNGIDLNHRCRLVCIPMSSPVEILDPKKVKISVDLEG